MATAVAAASLTLLALVGCSAGTPTAEQTRTTATSRATPSSTPTPGTKTPKPTAAPDAPASENGGGGEAGQAPAGEEGVPGTKNSDGAIISVPLTPPPPPVAQPSPDSVYLGAVREGLIGMDTAVDSDLIDAGWTACNLYGEGQSSSTIDVIGYDSEGEPSPGYNDHVIAVAAAESYCPEFAGQ
ncbi:hypothetical protein CLV54_3332 [Compostimonas suwonensis]|uniref:DUF732 domain-containing protein n=1 Tax=Compostimonas suwonensis TaxID=1048394 RepID=A0A2M9BB78_9MICO|nr:hypothetical protein CLV54_3332 [Compostimonas suwonensis]